MGASEDFVTKLIKTLEFLTEAKFNEKKQKFSWSSVKTDGFPAFTFSLICSCDENLVPFFSQHSRSCQVDMN